MGRISRPVPNGFFLRWKTAKVPGSAKPNISTVNASIYFNLITLFQKSKNIKHLSRHDAISDFIVSFSLWGV